MVSQLPPARPVTQDDKDDLLIPLVSGVQELLFAPVNPFNDRPGFVAGPTPSTGLGRAVQGITRLNCRLWASRDKSGYSPRVNQYNGEVCGPYLDDLGENPDGGFIGPPFEGGQCPGVGYVFNYQIRQQVAGVWGWSLTFQAFLNGPISIASFSGVDPNGCRDAGLTAASFNLINGQGQVATQIINQCVDQGPGYRVISIDVNGPQPDNCGNPPPVVQPPGTIVPVTPIVPNIDIDLPGIGPINITVDIGPKGNPIIIAPELGIEVEVSPDINVGGGGGGGDGGDPGDPTDPGDPGNPEGTGPGGGADGIAPEGTELVGLLVAINEAPADANRFANNPSQPYRGIGYVRMGFPGRLGLDISGGTVINPQFFHAQQRGLTAWAVAANTGFNLTITPYFRNIES